VSTIRLFAIVCDGCGTGLLPSAKFTNTAEPRRLARELGWKSIPGNGAARPNYTERQDYCPRCCEVAQ